MAFTPTLQPAHAGTSLSETIGSWADAKAALGELAQVVQQRFAPAPHRTFIDVAAVDHDVLGDQPTMPGWEYGVHHDKTPGGI